MRYQPQPSARLIKLTSTLIIPDITKTSSKLFIVALFSQNTNFPLVCKWIFSGILLKWPLPGFYKNVLKSVESNFLERRLILHKTGFPRPKFITPYFIDGQVFFWLCSSELTEYACINTWKLRASIGEKLHHRQRAKRWWTWRVTSITAKNKRSAHYKAHFYTMKVYTIRRVGPHQSIEGLLIKILLFFPTEVFTCSKVINAFKRSSLWTDLLQRSSTSLL